MAVKNVNCWLRLEFQSLHDIENCNKLKLNNNSSPLNKEKEVLITGLSIKLSLVFEILHQEQFSLFKIFSILFYRWYIHVHVHV